MQDDKLKESLEDELKTDTQIESDQPVAPPEQPSLPPEIFSSPENKSKKKLILVIIALFVVVGVGIGGYFGYQYVVGSQSSEKNAQVTASPIIKPAKSSLTSMTLVAEVKEGLSGKTEDGGIRVLYKSETEGFWVVADESVKAQGFTSTYTDSKKQAADVKVAKKMLLDKGLKLEIDNAQDGDDNYYIGHYASDKLACSIATDMTIDPTDSKGAHDTYAVYVSCVEVADLADTIAAIKPFAVAFNNTAADEKSPSYLANPKVTDSTVKSYKRATVSLAGVTARAGGSAGLFYQTPDGAWHFFLGTQSVLECSQYNTTDLKKAFAGDTCYNDTKESTVKP